MKIRLYTLLIAGSVSIPTSAADLINGWSQWSKISEFRSEFTNTLFKLENVGNGCGADYYWTLPMDGGYVEANRFKRSALLAAYMAGKDVMLRCEGSILTDFVVRD